MSSSASAGSAPTLRCPRCEEPIEEVDGGNWGCSAGHRVPVVAGILDCRPQLTGFDVDADRRLAEELAAVPGRSFEELLRRYWAGQPGVAPQLVERFVTGDLIAGRRAAAVADQIERLLGAPLPTDGAVLEIGGGTGALGVELARRCASVVITDISLAWLVLARRRVADAGLTNVEVVAATGDHLPVGRAGLALIVAADVVEHVPDAATVIAESCRALRPSGALWLSTPNRLSLTPEPHVRLWGVGLLPRRIGRAYVRAVRGVDYSDIRTLSLFALRRLLAATGGSWIVVAPEITPPVRATYSRPAKLLIDAYHVARRLPVVRHVVLFTAPLFHAIVRPAAGD